MTLKPIIEAILFASGEPVETEKLSETLGTEIEDIKKILEELARDYDERNSGFSLIPIGGKYQFTTRPQYFEYIRAVLETKRNNPLSPAAFEVLAVVAYNQPVTKAFIEQVRGVDCGGVLQTLCQRGLVEENGRLDLPGRPLLYGTTDVFLRCFSLNSLADLPPLPDKDAKLESVPLPDEDQLEGQTNFSD
ncbi:MAG: SMC-Scp complex subunit ScpB [Oscillospiraceae bacterium]|nr:SMC-Scp complex subunit ScpB [Oscillospiraceae bacterium]